ncbi:MAG: hypothetical protein EPO68_04530 [Planctomycetota bacterium]|nr:MAG: hypothetical protein EPO68_04530 [Planctomycetota bacterium]
MSSREPLDELYRRYPLVPQSFGERFAPLVERAVAAEPEVGVRILQLIEASFEKEHARRADELALRRSQERQVLTLVASVLHGWDPPDWLLQHKR